jgi:hypothetical protein
MPDAGAGQILVVSGVELRSWQQPRTYHLSAH